MITLPGESGLDGAPVVFVQKLFFEELERLVPTD